MDDNVSVDLLIVGAGPAGLFAAYYAGFRGLSMAIMDSLPTAGGQISAMYPEKRIYDVAGFPVVKGQDLVDDLLAQAAPFDPIYLLGHRAETLRADDDGVVVTSSGGITVNAKAMLITGGIGTFSPRQLPVGSDYEDRGLVYFVPRLEEMRDADVLIVGGGDSAVDWADSLQGIARSITLIHRRDRFRAHETSVEKMLAGSTRVLTPYEVAAIRGEPNLTEVDVYNTATNESLTLPVQAVVAALGFIADMSIFAEWGLEQHKRRILVDPGMRTNIPRVFAAGDIVTYRDYPDTKVPLIAVGFGEAATAVNNAMPVIDPSKKVFPGHSSDPL